LIFPPNSPDIARRNPQHGICVAGTPPPKFSLIISSPTPKRSLEPTLAAKCAKQGCANVVNVVVFGWYEEAVRVNIECVECCVRMSAGGVEKGTEGEWRRGRRESGKRSDTGEMGGGGWCM
jgi:hypothetical protein